MIIGDLKLSLTKRKADSCTQLCVVAQRLFDGKVLWQAVLISVRGAGVELPSKVEFKALSKTELGVALSDGSKWVVDLRDGEIRRRRPTTADLEKLFFMVETVASMKNWDLNRLGELFGCTLSKQKKRTEGFSLFLGEPSSSESIDRVEIRLEAGRGRGVLFLHFVDTFRPLIASVQKRYNPSEILEIGSCGGDEVILQHRIGSVQVHWSIHSKDRTLTALQLL